MQVWSNEGRCPFPRGDNSENTLPTFKKSFSIEHLGQFQSNLAQIIHELRERAK